MTIVIGLLLLVPNAKSQWTKAILPGGYASGYYLDVFFLPSDPNFGWACSLEGYVVRTTDAGDTWQGITIPNPFLESVHFLTRWVGYTSGPAGIYRSTDGGISFRDITPPSVDLNTQQGWGCYFLNENEGVYLVGGCSDGIQRFFKTVNGGNTWTVFYTQEVASGLSDAILYPDGFGYAVSSGVLWRTSNRGSSWEFHSYTGFKFWTEELAIFRNSFLLPTAGNDCSGSRANIGSMRFSVNGGYNFNEYQTNAAMFGSALINQTTGWGVGSNTTAVYTTNSGKTWTNSNCGLEGDLDDIFFVNDTLAWIAGDGLFKSNFNAIPRSVQIENNPEQLTVCEGDSVFVQASEGLERYAWSDGVKAQARYLYKPGVYEITAFDKLTCTYSADTIELLYKPAVVPVIQAANIGICEGDSVVLRVVGPYVKFAWSTTSTDDSIVVKKSGSYRVTTVDTGGCVKQSAPFTVTVHPLPNPEIQANRNTTICLDETVTLSAPPGYVKYEWSNGENTPSIVVSTAGVYFVAVTDVNGCVGISNSIRVIVLNIRNKVEIVWYTGDRQINVPNMPVGSFDCATVTIFNKSEDENLTIQRISTIANTLCSVPVTEFPMTIAPLSLKTFQVCCSALDTGFVIDTIVIPDTCSPTYLPVVTVGRPIELQGTSKCNVPIGTLIYRAGSAHQLYAPYPQPANETVKFEIQPPAVVTGFVVDNLGMVVATATTFDVGNRTQIEAIVANLPNGAYTIMIRSAGEPFAAGQFVVYR